MTDQNVSGLHEEDAHQSLELQWDPSAADVADYFANLVYISLGNSEVTLSFGRQLDNGRNGVVNRGLVRVTMSHSNFLLYVGIMSRQAQAISKLYGGELPDLNDARAKRPEVFQQIYEESQGR